MKRIRLLIQAEYEFPDDTSIEEIAGETALRLGGTLVLPTLDFLKLREATETSSTWIPAEEDLYDMILEGECSLVVTLSSDAPAAT
ncbi:hypothetical protein [Lysobacter sp. Root494]|uniref:hypothetical protein n=1 Tax=Lysobacter sp. Root494 TaxID=1736549 RepID=UPI0006F8FCCB|nr:hypothetical protein [Lysobacter sp. Root494]KQY51919.1 hypothetical protein ASD14_04400 [Lysobacter sp. Root494]